MERKLRGTHLLLGWACVVAATVATPGCVIDIFTTVMYRGRLAPAECTALEGKKVAIVCTANSGDFGPNPSAGIIARHIGQKLKANGKEITIVNQQNIDAWIDEHNVEYIDYAEVGRGVKADMVVGIDLLSFTLHEGQTLLKGRSKVGVKVYDMNKAGGELVYEKSPTEIAWPENGSRHVTENEANFRAHFIGMLAERIARDFYAYELAQNFGADARHLAN